MINLRQNKGFALAVSLLFLLLIVSFMAVYLRAVYTGKSEGARVADSQRAYYVADAGLVDAYQRITQGGAVNVPNNAQFIPAVNTDNGQYAVGNGVGNYTVSISSTLNPQLNYTVTSTGTYGSATRTLQLKIIGATIARFAYWSNTEDNPAFGGPLWWVGEPGLEMLTTGPVQTNGQLNIFGNPIFNGPVTESNLPILQPGNTLGTVPTSTTPDYYPGVPSNPAIIFPQGIQNDAPPLTLPPQPVLSDIQTAASGGQGLVLTGANTIIFNSAGGANVTGQIVDSNCHVTTLNNQLETPANGVFYVQSSSTIPACHSTAQDGNATVQGTVSGQITVGADQNIFMSGSVTYNDNPRTDPTSQDLVGLVANQNITVIEASAPTALEVDGVLEAIQGSFQVDQWWVYRGDQSTAVMDQFGALINYVCGATGEMDMSGNLLGGWNQVQSYDTRLTTMAPPGFPAALNNAGQGVYNKYFNPQYQYLTECVNNVCG